jgi:hypothetical protein
MTDPNPFREDEVVEVAKKMGECHGLVWDIDTGCHDHWQQMARAAILRLDQVREGRGK